MRDRAASGRCLGRVLLSHNRSCVLRLLPMKTKAEYEPDKIPLSAAAKAVERAQACVAIASWVVTSLP